MKLFSRACAVTAMVSAGLIIAVQVPTASAATFTAQLVARNSQKRVSVSCASTQNGAGSVQWDCLEGTNQHFRLG
ncbi:hypothetical protein [Streptomyces phaeoluteigriseus]|uniref:hypothetical protein n=1 Tax=Streptomyces phaeoluteigriseus TaxID=114686 RepID=UPI0036BCB03C